MDGQGFPYKEDNCENDSATGFFPACYGFYDLTVYEKALRLFYFSFTSLSTVGFGDFNPKSSVERVFVAFLLLFGVAIFSYIMGIFIEILTEFDQFDSDIDQGDELSKFFGVLKKFN